MQIAGSLENFPIKFFVPFRMEYDMHEICFKHLFLFILELELDTWLRL